MSIRSISEVVITTTAVCDNPECGTVHQANVVTDLPGLIISGATLSWGSGGVSVEEIYICKGSCAVGALKSVIEHGV